MTEKIRWWDRNGLMVGLRSALKLMDQNKDANIFRAEYHLGEEKYVLIVARRGRVDDVNDRLDDLFTEGRIDYSTHDN